MHDYLTETKMLDYSNENIKQLIRERSGKRCVKLDLMIALKRCAGKATV